MTTEPESPNATPAPQTGAIQKGSGHSTTTVAAIAAAIALLAFGGGALIFNSGDGAHSTPAETHTALQPSAPPPATAVNPPRMLEGAPFSFADLVERVSPAVVTVMVDREVRVSGNQRFGGGDDENDGDDMQGIPEPFQNLLRRFQREQPRVQRGEAIGSGFIIDPNGYIVTNNHVVDNGVKISVKLADGREFEAKLVGADQATDVALLKIENVQNLPTVAFGDDTHVRVGDWVVAVGNPFGLGGTVTAGIISSIGRDIGEGPYSDYIQIDAPINQGNSGGPTFDLTGRVIGMNSAIYSPSGGSVGIGFAIPASIVEQTVREIKEHGSVTRGWLGVEIQNLTPDMATSVGIPGAKGAIVAKVVAGSPAEKAGIRQGDVVLSIDGRDVADSRDMTRRVGAMRVGQKASFAIVRRGQHMTIEAVVARRDDRRVASLEQPNNGQGAQSQPNQESTITPLGMKMVALTDDVRARFRIARDAVGVLITAVDPNSEAADKGFRAGDLIVSVGNKDVRTPADVQQGLRDAASAGRESALFLVATEQGQRFVALRVGRG